MLDSSRGFEQGPNWHGGHRITLLPLDRRRRRALDFALVVDYSTSDHSFPERWGLRLNLVQENFCLAFTDAEKEVERSNVIESLPENSIEILNHIIENRHPAP